MASVEQIFAAMAEALPKSKFPKKVIVMTVDDTCYRVDGTAATVTSCLPDQCGEADLHVTTSLEVLQSLLGKKLTPQQAFMKGLLKIKGSMGLAMKLTILVNDTRAQLHPQSKL
jgi:putative sterol carrier protein